MRTTTMALGVVATMTVACSGELTGAGDLDTDELYAPTSDTLLVVMAHPDDYILNNFRTLRNTTDVRIIGDYTFQDVQAGARVTTADIEAAFAGLDTAGGPISIVLVGHSLGYNLWGDALFGGLQSTRVRPDDGGFLLDEVTPRYPTFAGRVAHMYLLGCNMGRELYLDWWKRPFPNLLTQTGFWNSAADGATGAWLVYSNARYVYSYTKPENLSQSTINTLRQGGFYYVAWKLYPTGKDPIYAVSKPELLGNPELEAYDKYTANVGAYEAYFRATDPAFYRPQDGNSNIREYYNGVQGLRIIYCSRPGDSGCPIKERELEPPIRLLHYRQMVSYWASMNYWYLGDAVARQLIDASTRSRREVLDIVRAYDAATCDWAIARGMHGDIELDAQPTDIVKRMAYALCGISFNELPEDAVTWERGLVIPPQPTQPPAQPDPPATEPPPPAPQGCGDLTYQGECVGDLVRYCLNGALVEENCAASGESCVYHYGYAVCDL